VRTIIITAFLYNILLLPVIFSYAEEADIFDAIESGNLIKIKSLLARDSIDLNKVNEDGMTPLIAAIFKGEGRVVQVLVDSGAELEMPMTGFTPLMIAMWDHRPKIALLLIRLGADVNAVRNGVTPLVIAAQMGNLEIATALVRAGADVHKMARGLAEYSHNLPRPPIVWAAGNNADIAKLLIRSGADVNATDSYGYTALMEASDLELIQELISAKADVNKQNYAGWTALMFLAGASKFNRIHEKAAHQSMYRDNQAERLLREGKQPMEIAIYLHRRIGEELLKAGADPNIKDNRGITPLELATAVKRTEIIELLTNTAKK